jgi:hypothetical protein
MAQFSTTRSHATFVILSLALQYHIDEKVKRRVERDQRVRNPFKNMKPMGPLNTETQCLVRVRFQVACIFQHNRVERRHQFPNMAE